MKKGKNIKKYTAAELKAKRVQSRNDWAGLTLKQMKKW